MVAGISRSKSTCGSPRQRLLFGMEFWAVHEANNAPADHAYCVSKRNRCRAGPLTLEVKGLSSSVSPDSAPQETVTWIRTGIGTIRRSFSRSFSLYSSWATQYCGRPVTERTTSQGGEPTSIQLSRMVDRLEGRFVSIEWVMVALGRRSFGLTLLVMAVIAFIPGASMIIGFVIAWPAIQMLLGKDKAELPRFVAQRKVPNDRLERVVHIVVPRMAWLEQFIRPRWPPPFDLTKRLIGVVVLLLGVTLISPLPFSHILPAFAILVTALAYLEEDGIALLVALSIALASLAFTASTVWATVETVDWLDPTIPLSTLDL